MRKNIAALWVLCSSLGCSAAPIAASPTAVAPEAPPPVTLASDATFVRDAKSAEVAAWHVIGCWIGGPWSETLGAFGEARAANTEARCRKAAAELFGPHEGDEQAARALASLEPAAVAKVELAVGRDADARARRALVASVAAASREAMAARRLAEALRRDLSAKDQAKHDRELALGAATLSAHEALTKLATLPGPRHDEAAALALVIAADHLEALRGLSPRAKVLAAAPAFETVFGVAPPKDATKSGDWLAFVAAAAERAGHPVSAPANASTYEREQSAFAGVGAGLADRMEQLVPALAADSAIHAVTSGYVERLRYELAEASTRAKAKAYAKNTTDEADREAKIAPTGVVETRKPK